uniref:ECT2 BRCT0 domain-containing protein n=1 Tax=Anopheles melas TaxID=34690 RepID=A0A182U9F7_9DIPT
MTRRPSDYFPPGPRRPLAQNFLTDVCRTLRGGTTTHLGVSYLGTGTAMSISTSPSTPEMTRICLVGPVAQDAATLAAAQSLKLPIVTSDTGAEYIGDDDISISTVFVLNDFEGPVYDAIYKAKQR